MAKIVIYADIKNEAGTTQDAARVTLWICEALTNTDIRDSNLSYHVFSIETEQEPENG